MNLDRIKRALPQAEKQVVPEDIEKAAAPVEEAVATQEALPIEEVEIPAETE
jgi:hypothetical protein